MSIRSLHNEWIQQRTNFGDCFMKSQSLCGRYIFIPCKCFSRWTARSLIKSQSIPSWYNGIQTIASWLCSVWIRSNRIVTVYLNYWEIWRHCNKITSEGICCILNTSQVASMRKMPVEFQQYLGNVTDIHPIFTQKQRFMLGRYWLPILMNIGWMSSILNSARSILTPDLGST